MTMTNQTYWERRHLQTKANEIKNSEDYERALQPRLNGLYRDLNAEMAQWVSRYAKNAGIDNEAAAKALNGVNTKHWELTLKQFEERARAGGHEAELNSEYYRSRVARLQDLEKQLRQHTASFAGGEQTSMQTELVKQYEDTYTRTNFNIQAQKANFTANFARFNENQLKMAVSMPWAKDGKDFSQRIWKNYTKELPSYLMDTVLRGTLLGQSPQRIASAFHARFQDVKRNNIHRLVITEMAHIAEEATAKSYEENEIDQYEYLATLESHTCEVCAHLDGEHFKTSERRPGVNYPTIHSRCRCTTVPWLEGLPDVKGRWYRDPETGKGKLAKNMKFDEWKRYFVDQPANDKRFSEIQDVLGKHAPTRTEYDALRFGSEEESQLKHALKTVKYIRASTKETEKLERKQVAEEAYYSFRDAGILMSGHAVLQYATRMTKKTNGKLLYNFSTITRVAGMAYNYIDSGNSRLVKYYDKIALISEPDSGEIVTLIRQRQPSKRWVRNETE